MATVDELLDQARTMHFEGERWFTVCEVLFCALVQNNNELENELISPTTYRFKLIQTLTVLGECAPEHLKREYLSVAKVMLRPEDEWTGLRLRIHQALGQISQTEPKQPLALPVAT